MPNWKPLSSFFHRSPIKSWDNIHKMFGDVFYDLDGNKIFRGQKLEAKNIRRPAALDNKKTVLGDLIPSTAWGASLANLLTKPSWDTLRLPIIQKNHNICELCGKISDSLEVHETWGHEFPSEDEWKQREESWVFGTQKLEGLMTVCSDCHRCFHLGKANVDGVLEPTLNRLAALNCWTSNEIERYKHALSERYEMSSEIFWMLDLSFVTPPEGGLVVRDSWKISDAHPLLIEFSGKKESVTALLNISWKFSSEKAWRAPVRPSDMT